VRGQGVHFTKESKRQGGSRRSERVIKGWISAFFTDPQPPASSDKPKTFFLILVTEAEPPQGTVNNTPQNRRNGIWVAGLLRLLLHFFSDPLETHLNVTIKADEYRSLL
jgi:hypothetical protein